MKDLRICVRCTGGPYVIGCPGLHPVHSAHTGFSNPWHIIPTYRASSCCSRGYYSWCNRCKAIKIARHCEQLVRVWRIGVCPGQDLIVGLDRYTRCSIESCILYKAASAERRID